MVNQWITNIRNIIKSKLSYTNWCATRENSPFTWIPIFSIIFFAGFYFLLVNLYNFAVVHYKWYPPVHISLIYLLLTIILIGAYTFIALKAQNDYVQPIDNISRNNWWVDILIGIGICYISLIIINIIWKLIFNIAAQGSNQMAINKYTHASGLVLLWFILMLVFFAPIGEEVFFRFMLIGPSNFGQSQMNNICRWIRIVISCGLFIYLHADTQIAHTNWSNSGSRLATIEVVLRYTIMGIILTYMYVRNNDLKASITTHIGLNTISCLTLFAHELFI